MTLPSWTLKLFAAAVIPAILGVGVAISAPSQPLHAANVSPHHQIDDDYRPGAFGVDLAAVGPTRSEVGKTRDCSDASWPIVPFSCRKAAQTGPVPQD